MTNAGYSHIVAVYYVSFTAMYTGSGWIMDRIGEKLGMVLCVLWWSIAGMLHAAAVGALSLGVLRFLLGLGAPGNYPGALRVCTVWFTKEERGVPIALFSSSSSLGSLLAVPLVSWLALHFSWRAAFLATGSAGLIWTIVWSAIYRTPAGAVNADNAASPPKPESPLRLLKRGNIRAIVGARLVSDPVWMFYLSWTPLYLSQKWGYSLKDIGLYAWIPFLFGSGGGIAAGSISDWLVRRGMAPAKARKVLLYASGAIAPTGMLIAFANSAAMALAITALMAFVCYVWFINTATLIPDVFPTNVVASVLGLMGSAGTLLGVVFTWFVGAELDRFHSWTPLFVLAGSGHLLGSLILAAFFREREEQSI